MLNMDEASLINKLNYIFREKYKKAASSTAASAERQLVDLAGRESVVPSADPLQNESSVREASWSTAEEEKNIFLIEKDILRLLINYGSKEIETGLSVAECVVKYFTENSMSFSKAEHQKVFDYIKDALYGGGVSDSGVGGNVGDDGINGGIDVNGGKHIPDVQELLSIEDEDVKNLVITLASSQYSVSDNWAKKGIYIQNEEERILDFWHSYMYEQLLAYINEQIEKNQQEIDALQDVDDQFILLAKRNNLNAVKKKLSAELNRIVR
jgi:DNA primase